jgi:monovalent cation:H+ antiporter, CPA1 family
VNEESAFILLFVVATGVALAVRVVRVPYTVALVLVGLAIGALGLFPAPPLTQDLLFSVFLPGLIFEAAFHIDEREFRDNWIMIVALAVLGVIASIALVALILPPIVHAFGVAPGFSWQHALVFGALISATDPVAVVGLFRYLRAPPRLATLLAGESSLNDGTAIVFFTLSLRVVEGGNSGAAELTSQFLAVVGMGAMIGIVIGAAGVWLIRRVDDPMIEIAVTTSVAWGSFVAAQTLNASGVIATVAAGMLYASYGARTGMSGRTRAVCGSFWEYVAFALNSIVFLLIGFEVRLPLLISYWLPVLVAYLVVTVARGLVIAANHRLAGFTRQRMPRGWSLVLAWGGLRGALPMVLVLTLPATFPYRQLLVSMTFGVALLSILLQGLTMRCLMTRLKVVYEPVGRTP